jgi:hypothetical protein
MKKPDTEKEVIELLDDMKKLSAIIDVKTTDLSARVGRIKGALQINLPASGAELDDDLPDLSPGVKA